MDGSDIECLHDYSSVFRSDALSGKVAFVSGGGTGINFRIAEVLMRHGCAVGIGSRRLAVVEGAKRKLESCTGGCCFSTRLDVRDKASIDAAVAETVEKLGPIDILVNGAAGNFLAEAEKMTPNAFRTVLDIDTTGTFLLSQSVFRACMKERGGVIINITATLHFNGEMLQCHAGAAKAANEAMSRHLANEWGRYNVRLNNVAPGPIQDTVGFQKLGGFLGAETLHEHLSKIALRRFGTTNDIAQAVLFLASDASSFMTGATLVVDGGAWFFSGGLVYDAMQAVRRAPSKL